MPNWITRGEGIFGRLVTESLQLSGAEVPGFFGACFYVDGDIGADTNTGKTWKKAKATIQAAVTAAADGDKVFIVPRTMAGTVTDPVNYAETIIIPAAKRLALIGIGGGPAQGAQPQIRKGSGSTALLTVRAAGCLIYNLSFNGASATGGGILLDDDGGTSKNAFGTVIENCFFKNCKGATATDAATGGAIQWPSVGNAWQVRIARNHFYKNVGDVVVMGTGSSVPQDVVIERNHFSTSPAAVDCNIYVGGSGVIGLIVHDNTFGELPALSSGANLRYIKLATGSAGIVSKNVFGSNGKTFGAAGDGAVIPTTVFLAGNYQEKSTSGSGEIFRT